VNAQDWLLIETQASRDGAEVTIDVVGDLDAATTAQMWTAVCGAASEPGVERVVVDLAEVGFISSSGVGLLLRCKEELGGAGIEFGVANVGALPLRVLELSRVTELIGLGPA